MRLAILGLAFWFLISCKSSSTKDEKSVKESIANSTSELATDWKFVKKIELDDATLKGIAEFDDESFVVYNESNNDFVLIKNGQSIDILFNCKQANHFISLRGRMMIPTDHKPHVQIWRNEPYDYNLKIAVKHATAFAANTLNRYVLLDGKNDELHIVHDDFQKVLATKGSGDLEFNGPTDLHVEYTKGLDQKSSSFKDQRIFVLDSGNQRVQVINLGGEFLNAFGSDHLKKPEGICYFKNRLFVTDGALNKVFIFSLNGDLISTISSELENPYDLIGSGNQIFVTNRNKNFISVFEKS